LSLLEVLTRAIFFSVLSLFAVVSVHGAVTS